MTSHRPIVISIIQYQDDIAAGRMTVFDLINRLPGFGVAGIELRRETWQNYQSELPAVRDLLKQMGMIVTYGSFSTLFSSTDESRRLLRHDLETAQALGSPLLRVFPGAAPDALDDPAWQQAVEIVDYAASLNVVIALENFGKTPGGKLSEVLHILNRIQSPALQTNIDIGNYDTNGEDVVTAIHALGSRAVYAHLKDKAGERSDSTTYLGGGTLPMRKIVTALNQLPQPIIYCFEFVGAGEADSRIEKSVAFLRSLESQ
ncbi:MAG: sugar phosphate isomerase/epimerase [Anaerolineae bacterium]|nr:sugar phosphate isomerase/epimerase [Anaerolineae bacterium]